MRHERHPEGVGGGLAAPEAAESAVGAVLLQVLLTKMIADWFAGREIIWAMTILINAWPIGIGAALFTLPVIAKVWGLSAVFLVAAGAAAAGAVAIALLYSPAPGDPAPVESTGPAGLSLPQTTIAVYDGTNRVATSARHCANESCSSF
jgi:hypothetical protein